MANDPGGGPPASLSAGRDRVRAVVAGLPGFAVAVGLSLALIVGLWLAARGGPSAAGEPFRFIPPPEAPAAVATATATNAPATPAGAESR